MTLFRNTKQIIAWILIAILTVFACVIFLTLANRAAANIDDTVEPVLELTTDKVIINTGDEFDAKAYIKTATNKYGEDITDTIKTYDISTDLPGTYEVVFQYMDGDDLIKSKTLKVIVTGEPKNLEDTATAEQKADDQTKDTEDKE